MEASYGVQGQPYPHNNSRRGLLTAAQMDERKKERKKRRAEGAGEKGINK